MNAARQQDLPSTSTAGPMNTWPGVPGAVVIGSMLVSAGPSGMGAMADVKTPVESSPSTETGSSISVSRSTTASAIGELRRLRGLTGDQLARLFPTSRRALARAIALLPWHHHVR